MPGLLLLGPALLGGACLGLSAVGSRMRSRVITAISAVGIVGGVSLAWFVQSGTWRTTGLRDAPALDLAGLAVAGAWALVAVLDLGRGRWDVAALVGVASTGLLLFAANRWAVPGLLFWLCSSVALVALAARARNGRWVWVAVLLSDGALVAGLTWSYSLTNEWAMPAPVTGTGPFYLLVGVALLRAGIIPGVGAWQTLGSRSAPALPLLVAGSFAVLAGPAGRSDPWIAAGALAFGAIVGATVVAGTRGGVSAAGAWFVALMLGAGLAAPGVADTAGAAAVLTAIVVALWPFSYGRGRATRGLLMASLPATAGFPALASAAAVASDRAVPLGRNDSVAWVVVAGVLLVSAGIGVALGARVATQRGPDTFEPRATIATWGVGAVSVGVGIVALASDALRPSGEATGVVVIGAIAGLAAGAAAARRPLPVRTGPGIDFGLDLLGYRRRAEVLLAGVAGLLAAIVGAGAAGLTIQGLRVGFL